MKMSARRTRFLLELPEPPLFPAESLHWVNSPKQLISAAAANHTEWFAANAHASGGTEHETNGVTWTLSEQEMTVAFPRLDKANASTTLDEILSECFRAKPHQASCWSLSPTQPRDLGARLAARGFEWGWRPHWMARELDDVEADFPLPDGLHLAVDTVGDWDVGDLPYYRRDNAPLWQKLMHTYPNRFCHIGAWLNRKIVGHSAVFLTTGAQSVAGIYNVGVIPSARKQNIGKAVSLAACQWAHRMGCRYATLNSAADGLYERLGFVSLGYGQTWWMHAPAIQAGMPTPAQIAFAEAVGRGDIAALDALPAASLPDDLDAPLPNGMTPMMLAVSAKKPSAAEWLAAHGTTLGVLHAWDLGWKARARQMLKDTPELANRRSGNWQTTALHEAVSRNDLALARLLLTANPDLTLQDSQFHSTPLGWARHFQNAPMIALLEKDEG